jgi:ubiquitin C-terminal hydrolase
VVSCCTSPQEEEVEKACERCGGANVAHTLRHAVQRLPRVLCLHLKRFKARRCCPPLQLLAAQLLSAEPTAWSALPSWLLGDAMGSCS